MKPRKPYFSLYELSVLSICGGLIFVLKTAFKIPLHLPGHSGIFWVIPVMFAVAVVRKPGSGTYVGVISGLLTAFFGMDPLGMMDSITYLALGVAVDIEGVIFRYRFDHPAIGFVVGASSNIAKMLVNYAIQLALGVLPVFIILGIGISSVTHLVFGGIGGIIAAVIIARLMKAGIIAGHET
ncbi:hypothetical protein J2741_000689 [Methanolinea mesophila]|uniref:ECF transporter S component n=1 Tax=Methanolinea mesophila TaxID=547055 RepID=UPI001AE642AA|nr:ECF transporter S component [Methanolinea mesophila]MBP1928142.1 hypothetical protein [Methanolinea mesophila]